jgi:hypothetical protein
MVRRAFDLLKLHNLYHVITRSVSFEVAHSSNREAMAAPSLGRQPKELGESSTKAAKRRQQNGP